MTILSRHPVFEASAVDGTLAVVRRSLESGRLVGGQNVELLEGSLSRFWGRPAIATRSGMDALALLFESVGVRNRDVLIPANCFANVAALACEMGARAVPVHVDDVSLAMLYDDLCDHDRHGALAVWVHHCGMVAADAPAAIARLRAAGCFVIEDCAYLVPPEDPGPGAWGDATVLSFAATKPVPAGTGGALLCADPQLAVVAGARRPHGGHEARWRAGDRFGHDRRLDEIAAAIALHQWGRIDAIRARLAAVGRAYAETLGAVCPEALVAGRSPQPTWSKFAVRLPQDGPNAIEALARLRALGIEASTMYERPWPDYPWFAHNTNAALDRRDWSALRALLARTICLPYHERLAATDIDGVTTALAELSGA
jgi:dTDP-4-amino-4,6-dideoxygalactose transaminase